MRLQEIRKNRKLTQKKLAEMSGVPLRTIQMYEIGGRNVNGASLETLLALSTVLGVPFFDLLESDELQNRVIMSVKIRKYEN